MSNNEYVAVTVRDNLGYTLRRQGQMLAYRLFGPKFMAQVYYRIVMKKKLDLHHPKTLTEKINWYKLFYCPQNQLIIQCSDKYTVRRYLEERGLGEYLSELIGVWDDPEQIDWDMLPSRFALKNSNGCGYNIVCKDKDHLDERETKLLLRKWLREHFGYYNAEPHYEAGKKRIICEQYIESTHLLPIDYKIHCMNGMPRVMQVCDERTAKETKYFYYDMEGHPFSFGKYPQSSDMNISAEMLADMNRICRIIAPDFPYVRIDFFVNNGKLQLGELTFSPSAGLKPDLQVGNGDRIMGDMLDLETIIEVANAK